MNVQDGSLTKSSSHHNLNYNKNCELYIYIVCYTHGRRQDFLPGGAKNGLYLLCDHM